MEVVNDTAMDPIDIDSSYVNLDYDPAEDLHREISEMKNEIMQLKNQIAEKNSKIEWFEETAQVNDVNNAATVCEICQGKVLRKELGKFWLQSGVIGQNKTIGPTKIRYF